MVASVRSKWKAHPDDLANSRLEWAAFISGCLLPYVPKCTRCACPDASHVQPQYVIPCTRHISEQCGDLHRHISLSVRPHASEEVAKMLEINRLNAQSIPTEIAVSELSTDFGPTVGLLMRNAVEGNAAAPFPFARKIAKPPDGSLRSLSVHRMFVRGPDRIEVAGLQYFEP